MWLFAACGRYLLGYGVELRENDGGLLTAVAVGHLGRTARPSGGELFAFRLAQREVRQAADDHPTILSAQPSSRGTDTPTLHLRTT